jgi:peptidoglycan/LPS O-acetylase OafA/YrhL
MAILLLALVMNEGLATSIFRFKPLRMVGQVSYSFYLLHALISLPLSERLGWHANAFEGMWGHYFGAVLLTFTLSSFLYCYLERPYFERKARKRANASLAMTGPANRNDAAAAKPEPDVTQKKYKSGRKALVAN